VFEPYQMMMLFLGLLLVVFALYAVQRRTWLKKEEKLFQKIDIVTEELLDYIPVGIAVVDEKATLLWYNSFFGRILGREDIKGNIGYLLPELAVHRHPWFSQEKTIQITLKEKIFRVESRRLKNGSGFVLSFEDITERVNIDQHRQEDRPVIGLIQIDNFSETVQDVEEEKRPLLLAEIDKVLAEWAVKMEGILRKYAEDRYLLVISQEALRESQKSRFDIMDRMREINLGNKIPLTLSMGIGTGEETIMDLSRLAHGGLELALGRGGDQAVVKWADRVLFYGGKSNVVEKKTKVRARVVAYTLRHYIQQASNVIVMGHEGSDLDSAGASLGVAKIALNYEKQVHVVLDNSSGTLDRLLEIMEDYPEYTRRIFSGREALQAANKDTLLVICDTHKPSLLIEPAVLGKVGRTILIDHHRRAEEFINEAQLVYVEPYASSTCELVTEILQYLGEEVTLDSLVASVLLAGIVVDTKNFIFQTGVRTFEAAGFLRRAGAEAHLIRKLLQDDFDTVLERARVIQSSEILYGRIAVAILDRIVPHHTIIAAQTADILLSIENIKASFVLYAVPEGVHISGRSSGEINVQVLLERLGGGGHLTVAGAQLKGIGIPEAKEKLNTVLKEYLEENSGVI